MAAHISSVALYPDLIGSIRFFLKNDGIIDKKIIEQWVRDKIHLDVPLSLEDIDHFVSKYMRNDIKDFCQEKTPAERNKFKKQLYVYALRYLPKCYKDNRDIYFSYDEIAKLLDIGTPTVKTYENIVSQDDILS